MQPYKRTLNKKCAIIALALYAARSSLFVSEALADPASQPTSQPSIVSAEQRARDDAYALVKSGRSLSASDVDAMEDTLKTKPDAIDVRSQLVGYYFDKVFTNVAGAKPASDLLVRRQQNVLWLIGNHPDAAVLQNPAALLTPYPDGLAFRQGAELWLHKVSDNKDNVAILGNAAEYFLEVDGPTAETLLKHLLELDPNNMRWLDRLTSIYRVGMMGAPPAEARLLATKAMPLVKQEVELTVKTARKGYLFRATMFDSELTGDSILVDDGQSAEAVSLQLLKALDGETNEDLRAFVMHHVNVNRGRIAIWNGKVDDAKKFLVQSQVVINANIHPIQPDFTLANALLAAGESAAVVDFLRAAAQFYPPCKADVARWTADINGGKKPVLAIEATYN